LFPFVEADEFEADAAKEDVVELLVDAELFVTTHA
jgi:hypothetical protein